ncbi:hypothetical protein FOZ62_016667 [Perkinsus olseni]|uniref:Uncharacterized protein n=1 Tax=Perkinsus olseni TaxID=32597 RepID=A0A7J6PVU4_PEROL|nr:hypothetical protein FOZ62_016667 [Perkinsus olseni]
MEIYFIIVDLDRLLIDYREGIDRLLVERYGHSPANLTSHSIEGCVRTLKAIVPDIGNIILPSSWPRGAGNAGLSLQCHPSQMLSKV